MFLEVRGFQDAEQIDLVALSVQKFAYRSPWSSRLVQVDGRGTKVSLFFGNKGKLTLCGLVLQEQLYGSRGSLAERRIAYGNKFHRKIEKTNTSSPEPSMSRHRWAPRADARALEKHRSDDGRVLILQRDNGRAQIEGYGARLNEPRCRSV